MLPGIVIAHGIAKHIGIASMFSVILSFLSNCTPLFQ